MEATFQIANKKINEGLNKGDAFKNFKIDDYACLEELEGRSPCPECCKSRKFFCYTCYTVMPPLEGKLPKVKVEICITLTLLYVEVFSSNS